MQSLSLTVPSVPVSLKLAPLLCCLFNLSLVSARSHYIESHGREAVHSQKGPSSGSEQKLSFDAEASRKIQNLKRQVATLSCALLHNAARDLCCKMSRALVEQYCISNLPSFPSTCSSSFIASKCLTCLKALTHGNRCWLCQWHWMLSELWARLGATQPSTLAGAESLIHYSGSYALVRSSF